MSAGPAAEPAPGAGPRGGAGRVAQALHLELDATTAACLARMGRTEDLAFSPDGRRLCVVGFGGKVLVAAVGARRDEAGRVAALEVTDGVVLLVPGGAATHGIDFLDDGRIVVADREGPVSILDAPSIDARATASAPDTSEWQDARVVLDVSEGSPVFSPHGAAVGVSRLERGLADVFVCDGNLHQVTRHLVQTSDDAVHLVDSEVVLRDGLCLPDGVSVSPDGRFLAVGNHESNQVFVHVLRDGAVAPDHEVGVLDGITYPHGVAFAAGGRAVLVTDAGAPSVQVFLARSAGAVDGPEHPWSGRRAADAVVRVMDEETFGRGHVDRRNGGPKGIAVHDGLGLVGITCANLRLAVFHLDDLVGDATRLDVSDAPDVARHAEVEARLLRRMSAMTAAAAEDRVAFGYNRRRLQRALLLVHLIERSPVWRLLVWLRYGRRIRRAARLRRQVHAANRYDPGTR